MQGLDHLGHRFAALGLQARGALGQIPDSGVPQRRQVGQLGRHPFGQLVVEEVGRGHAEERGQGLELLFVGLSRSPRCNCHR